MSQVKTSGVKPRKRKNPLTAHRKSSQFKDFVKLLRESHERVSSSREGELQVQAAQA